MTITVYTDASFNHIHKIAACGFCAFYRGAMIKHEVSLVGGLVNSSMAEIYAITEGLQFAFMVKGVKHIVLYTDCLTVITTLQNKKANIWKQKVKTLYETIEMIRDWGIPIRISHVKAHESCAENNKVDYSCKKALREYLKQKDDGNKKRRHYPSNRR